MTNPEYKKEQITNMLKMSIENTLNVARLLNIVIDVELKPCQPLEMGNYEMVANFRDKNIRNRTYLSNSEVQAVTDNVLKAEYVVFNWDESGDKVICEKTDNDLIFVGMVTTDQHKYIFNWDEHEHNDNNTTSS